MRSGQAMGGVSFQLQERSERGKSQHRDVLGSKARRERKQDMLEEQRAAGSEPREKCKDGAARVTLKKPEGANCEGPCDPPRALVCNPGQFQAGE